jgi:hypothetical protein
MPRLTVPIKSKIDQLDQNRIEIRIRNTNFWIHGEKKAKSLWDAYLFDPTTNRREILRENVTTYEFALFSNIILKTPFPYSGKRAENMSTINKFVKKITKKRAYKHTTSKSRSAKNHR